MDVGDHEQEVERKEEKKKGSRKDKGEERNVFVWCEDLSYIRAQERSMYVCEVAREGGRWQVQLQFWCPDAARPVSATLARDRTNVHLSKRPAFENSERQIFGRVRRKKKKDKKIERGKNRRGDAFVCSLEYRLSHLFSLRRVVARWLLV
jgi:hypothetical protein